MPEANEVVSRSAIRIKGLGIFAVVISVISMPIGLLALAASFQNAAAIGVFILMAGFIGLIQGMLLIAAGRAISCLLAIAHGIGGNQ